MIRPELQHLAVPVSEVRPHPHNARRGDVETIAASLAHHGQYRPIICRRETGEILVGNHTFAAMLELGAEHVAVRYVDVDEERAAQITAIDNRTSDLAKYDDGLLAGLLDGLDGDLAGTGFDDYSHEALLRRIADAVDWAGTRDQIVFAFGRIHFEVDAETYRGWVERMTAEHGEDVIGALRRRLEV